MAVGDDIPNYGGLLSGSIDRLTSSSGGADYANANQLAWDTTTMVSEGGAADRAAAQGPAVGKITTKIDKDGMVKHDYSDITDSTHQWIQQMIGIAQSAIAEKTKLNTMLANKRDVLEKNPALAQIGKILSLAATAYQAPNSRGAPLVHAAGAYAGEYFQDSPESLQRDIAQNEAQKVAIAAPIANQLASEARLSHQDQVEADREAARNRRLDLAEEKATRSAVENQISSAINVAKQTGAYTAGELTDSIYAQAGGKTPENEVRAAAAEARAQTAALAYKANQQAENKDKLKLFEDEEKIRGHYDEIAANRRLEIEKKLIDARGEKNVASQQNWFSKLNGIEDDVRKARLGALEAVGTLGAIQKEMLDAGVPGWSAKMTPTQITLQAQADLAKGNVEVTKDGKKQTITVNQILGITDEKTAKDTKDNIVKAGALYQSYKETYPRLKAQHEEVRKMFEASSKEKYPPLEPTAEAAKAPPPLAAPAGGFVTQAQLEAMTPEQIATAAKGNRIPPALEPKARELVQKKTAATPKPATPTSLQNVTDYMTKWLTETNTGGASGRY